MESPRHGRAFTSLDSALRFLALALFVAAIQSARGFFSCIAAIVRGNLGPALPSRMDLLVGLAAVAVGAIYLRRADDNAQALAGGGLLPLTLRRLLQPRFEHPLRELWTRSDPSTPAAPMPRSRSFGTFWNAGLALALPLWAFALIAPFPGRIAIALDAAHHLAMGAACIMALHFAAMLARRQDEAWKRAKPGVAPAPLRMAARRALPLFADVPAGLPAQCAICGAKLSGHRCDACGAPALAGSFRVLKQLGGTGPRRTYLADAPDGARVVLKEFALATTPDPQSLGAFAREAKMLRELRHPKLPMYVEAFQEEEGPHARLYLASRYVEGVSLLSELEDRNYGEEEVLNLIEAVLEILRYLQALQPPLIHGDLKPANLVRRRDGAIALVDFNAFRSLERPAPAPGTAGYAPPEQFSGHVDLTSDLYALGATALHLLTRTAPALPLPPLETAPVARAFLKRMVAPRPAQRFSSAREALHALRLFRTGRTRWPRAAVRAAAIAAATILAAGLGAERRIDGPPAPLSSDMRKQRPVQAAARPASAPSEVLVHWRGGALTRAQIKESLRRLPPWLKRDQPWWIQQHALALVKRRLLAAEAEKRGLGSGLPAGGDRERRLVRALLDAEASADPDWVRARALRSAWTRLTAPLVKAAQVKFEEQDLFQLAPTRLLGQLPSGTPGTGPPIQLDFFSATGPCTLLLEPALLRYGGRCEGAATLAQALLEPDTLQLADLSPRSDEFYSRYTDDFVEAKQLAGRPGIEAAELAERALERAELRVAGVTGTISFAQVQSLLAAVAPALRRCLAVGLQESPDQTLRARARIAVELRDGQVISARVETEPSLPASGCAQALARQEIAGTGSIAVVADLSRAPGMPGRVSPPAPPPPQSWAAPVRRAPRPRDPSTY